MSDNDSFNAQTPRSKTTHKQSPAHAQQNVYRPPAVRSSQTRYPTSRPSAYQRNAWQRVAQQRIKLQRRRKRNICIGVLVLAAVLIAGGIYAYNRMEMGIDAIHASHYSQDDFTFNDQSESSNTQDSGNITLGLYGSKETYVLVGEEYLEAGAYAREPQEGILNDAIEVTGNVDSTSPGDYEVIYKVSDSSGHTATTKRTVHVVQTMNAQKFGIPVLMYHYIYSQDNPPEDLNGNYLLDTSFEAQLQYLKDNDFYFPSYQELAAFLEGSHTLPERSVVLTFDDAETGFLQVGIPLLDRYQIPATSFLICNDEDASDKVMTYESEYVSFQSHSYAMHDGGGSVGHGGIISTMSEGEILEDLLRAQSICGADAAFAYPFGDVTDTAEEAVQEAGILCAFTTVNSWCSIGDDLSALPRVRISAEYSLEGFEYLVNNYQ